MLTPHLTFHHLGLATAMPAEAAKFLAAQGYDLGEAVFDPLQRVNLRMCTHARPDMPAVELITPSGEPGPIDNLLARHQEGLVYHCCYETGDLDGALQALAAAGVRLRRVSPPQPAVLFALRRVSFHQVLGVGLIEILEPLGQEHP